nr:aspartic proteinase-like protein 2 isoform X2 [Ipomoea batatas]
MAGLEFLMVVSILAAAAVALPAVKDGSGTVPNRVITLERAFPANEKMEVEVVRARDRLRHARMLQSLAGGIVNFSIAGLADPTIFGLYYANVKLGSPPREYNVQFDTGSDLLWLACTSCQGCPTRSGLGLYPLLLSFLVRGHICSSITQTAYAECFSESNQCGYSFQYGDGSGTAGHYVSDMLYFDMVMGNSLVRNSSAPVVFGPHYNLYMQSISVNGRVLPIDPAVFATSGDRGAIVDSGTTLAYLASEAYEPFINAINDLVWQSTSPFVSKGMQCYVVNARPGDYLFRTEHFDRTEYWCNGFQKHEQGVTILGDLVLKDKIVVYDIANQRVGWADHDCSTTVNVSITSGKDEFTNVGQLSVNRSPRALSTKRTYCF